MIVIFLKYNNYLIVLVSLCLIRRIYNLLLRYSSESKNIASL